MMLVVDLLFLGSEGEVDDLVLSRWEVEEGFARSEFRFLGSTKSDVTHDDLKTSDSDGISVLGWSGDVFGPDGFVVEGFETDELDESPEVVELVLDGSSGEADSTLSFEVAGCSSGDGVGVLDEAGRGTKEEEGGREGEKVSRRVRERELASTRQKARTRNTH